MAHQQQPSHPPYNNNGGRGRGNNNHAGGRGGGNPNNNNHNSGGYQNSGNHNYPNMNYATPGRGGGGGGAWQNHHPSPHHNMHHQQQPHHPAYVPGPTGVPVATAAAAAASTVGTPNATPQIAPAISASKPPQPPGVVAGAAGPTAIQSPPLNSSLQQSLQQGVGGGVPNQHQHQRTPSSNLQPAPPAVPHTYGNVTPQQQQHQQQQQYRQQQQLQSPMIGMPNQQQHYNNPYHQHPQYGGVANQYGYPPAYQRQHQQQWEQQQMQYNTPNGGNNPYATGGMVRTPVGGGAGAMYYPVMQQPHMTPGATPTNGGVGTTPSTSGSSLMNAAMAAIGTGASTTPNVVVPAPRPKKILTITDKDGNVIDFSSMKNTKTTATPPTGAASVASTTSKTSTTAATSTTTPSAPTAVSQSSTTTSAFSSKLFQVALARIEGKDIKSSDEIESMDATPAATATLPTPTVDVTTNTTSSESIDTPLATKTETKEMEVAVSITQTKDEITKTLPTTKTEIDDNISQTTIKKSSLEEQLTKSSEAVVDIVTPKASSTAVEVATKNNDLENARFFIYTKKILLGLKELPECMERPDDLPEMEIVRTEVRAGGSNRPGPTGGGGGNSGRRNSSQRNMDNSSNSVGGGGGGGDQWARGNTAPPRRQSSQSDRPQNANNTVTPDQWSRGQAPPKQQGPNANAKGAGRSTRGSFAQVYEEPVEPLVKSENHWRPKKNTSAFVVAEKKVKSILNKMTKEKFDRLSEQMLEIPLLSYETLNMMINHVYEKAIDEPAFGELYANLCSRLSQIASDNKFVHIIESDEEPPTDDGEVTTSVTTDNIDDTDGRNKVYRWSHDVSTTDAEIIGPLSSIDECMTAPFDGTERTPIPRGDTELELVNVIIRRTLLIKIMKKKSAEDAAENSDNNEYYVVYFPVKEAEECGQQISEIFLSEVECRSDASKKNSFKRSLLNKCEEEFNKKDIYDNWQKEKQQYEEMKSKLTDQERAIQESELNFRRIKIKKQMLGNVKFIGQLYKVNLLREKVMRFCIGSMLKLEERKDIKAKNPEYEDTGNTDMDEEDHEAICNMFATIGSTIDKPPAADFMKVCFQKIDRLIQDKNLPSRSKFMYKDLIDLRSNNWVPRRKEEKAKTIAEIREDVEAEERRQAQLSAQLNARSNKNDPRSSGRNDFYQQRQTSLGAAAAAGIGGNRPRIAKPVVRTDDDGFTTVAGPSRSNLPGPAIISSIKPVPSMMKTNPNANAKVVAPLTQSELERRIKGMRSDYISTNGNVPELLLSWDEIATTPNAGADLVRKNIETLMECKDTERNAIYKMIRDLCEKGKLTKSDVQTGLLDNIEFIDDIVVDCPRAYEFLGTMIGDMLQIKMFDIKWFCDQCEKTKESNPDSIASEKLLRFAVVQWKKLSNSETVRSQIQANDVRLRQLTGPSALQAIIDEI